MKGKKKCSNCNATIENDLCEFCGLDNRSPSKSKNYLVGKMTLLEKYSTIVFAILIILVIISCAVTFTDVSESIKDATMITPLVILVGLVVFGGLVVLRIGYKTKVLYTSGKKTKGKIVDHKEVRNTLAKVYVPIIEFEVNKTKYRTLSNNEVSKECKIGEKVEVIYDEKNPYDSMALVNASKYKEFIIGGIGCIIFAILLVLSEILF